MPAMPRQSSVAEKIAYKIMGVPINMRKVKKAKRSQRNKRLDFEETSRLR